MVTRNGLRLLCASALLWLSLSAAQAAELGKPEGPVVLTLAGEIQNTNRPAFDTSRDLFLKYQGKEFSAAAEFDYAMLEALGMHQVEISIPAWPAPVRLEGPRLQDLMAAVGAGGKTALLVALDGFASEISWAEVTALDWIVGIKRDGKYLGLGQRGPLWVVYSYPDGRDLTDDDELRWPWATFYIEVD
ncbi:MAG: hypothetical protein RH942_11045 [Kiloniellaceae bacterium]